MPLIEANPEKNETLALLSSINAPLLQHQKKRIRTLSTKQELVQLKLAGRTVADFTKNLFDAGKIILKNADKEPIHDYGDSEISKFKTRINLIAERVNFGSATWNDAIEIFEIKAILLSTSLQDFLDAIKSSPRKFSRSFTKSIQNLKIKIELLRRKIRNI